MHTVVCSGRRDDKEAPPIDDVLGALLDCLFSRYAGLSLPCRDSAVAAVRPIFSFDCNRVCQNENQIFSVTVQGLRDTDKLKEHSQQRRVKDGHHLGGSRDGSSKQTRMASECDPMRPRKCGLNQGQGQGPAIKTLFLSLAMRWCASK